MAPKPATAKITDLETSFDAIPIATPDGEMIWAEVRMEYILYGLKPCVTIRVPVPWSERDTAEERKAKALRCARQLIDHACQAAGVRTSELDDEDTIAEAIDAATPSPLEGIAQELGLATPTSEPRRTRGSADI